MLTYISPLIFKLNFQILIGFKTIISVKVIGFLNDFLLKIFAFILTNYIIFRDFIRFSNVHFIVLRRISTPC